MLERARVSANRKENVTLWKKIAKTILILLPKKQTAEQIPTSEREYTRRKLIKAAVAVPALAALSSTIPGNTTNLAEAKNNEDNRNESGGYTLNDQIELKKQYGPEHGKVEISGLAEKDFISVIILTKDGELETYSRVGGPKFKSDEARTTISTEPPGRAKISLSPPDEQGVRHKVKTSTFMSMVGSPGCRCSNGTWEWWP